MRCARGSCRADPNPGGSMSRSKRIGKARAAAATVALDRVRQVAVRVKPFASSARAAGGRGVHRARALAAPQVESAGKALENRVAPKVSAMLSSAAQRIEPAGPRRRRWRKLAGISLTTGAASAVPATKMRDEKARTSADTDVDTQARTSRLVSFRRQVPARQRFGYVPGR